MTKGGIAGLDRVRWGSRFHHFHKGKADLIEELAAFCAAGLREGHACVWILSPEVSRSDAMAGIRRRLDGAEDLSEDQLRFIESASLNVEPGLLLEWEREARASGFRGLRIARRLDWESFDPARETIPDSLGKARILELRSYPLDGAPPDYIVGLMKSANTTITCCDGVCEPVENEALRIAMDDLRRMEDAARKKDEFIAMLGHELRNPLAPIFTALDLIRLRSRKANDSYEREHGIIERQVRHLADLVDDMLDISRITQGKVALRRQPEELFDILARAIELSSPLFEEKLHRLTVNVPRHGMILDADASRLAQVFSNLLTNAAKFTAPRGDIQVRASQSADGKLVITVSDDGRGIPEDRLDSIFEPFEQASTQASDRAEGGIGLGLAIAKTLVELHEGTIEVESRVGRGTEVTVTLPAVGAERGLDTEESEFFEEPEGAKILVVDDNRDAAVMLAEYLTAVGYIVAVAHDGPSALEAARSFHPNTALLDIGLPVMDGYELAEHLRGMEGMEHVRLIAITGYGQERDRQRSQDAGFHEHMVKPVDLAELLRALPFPVANS